MDLFSNALMIRRKVIMVMMVREVEMMGRESDLALKWHLIILFLLLLSLSLSFGNKDDCGIMDCQIIVIFV